jgi:hypothetical protein
MDYFDGPTRTKPYEREIVTNLTLSLCTVILFIYNMHPKIPTNSQETILYCDIVNKEMWVINDKK